MIRDLLVDVLPLASAMFLVRLVAAEAAYQRGQRIPRRQRFPAGLGLRLAFRLGGPFLLFVAYKMLAQAQSSFDCGMSLVVAVMGLGCLLGEPGPITATTAGIVQTTLLGLRRRRIEWSRAEARYIPALREVLVIGGDGTSITHSQHHAGQSEFIHQLKRHGVHVQGADARP